MAYNFIKERLLSILNSNKTINFLKTLNDNEVPLSNSIPILNLLIKKVFSNEKDVLIIKYTTSIYDVIINNKRILIRLNLLAVKNKKNSFKNFAYEREENVVIEDIIEEVNDKIDSYDYIFLIRVEEEGPDENLEKKFKACYHYYLIPIDIFKIDEEEKKKKIMEEERKKSSKNFRGLTKSYSGKKWILENFHSFSFKYSNEILNFYNIGFPYVNC